ncbi:MAG: hypothetical protein M3Y87_33175, partial [Myxococcota bacterium]|nr:hypothetical protein [Myxococcota bacterium]
MTRAIVVMLAIAACIAPNGARADGDETRPAARIEAGAAGVTSLVRRRARPMLPERARCARFAGVRPEICDGPRRVPMPTIAAADRAARLGLGTHEAA